MRVCVLEVNVLCSHLPRELPVRAPHVALVEQRHSPCELPTSRVAGKQHFSQVWEILAARDSRDELFCNVNGRGAWGARVRLHAWLARTPLFVERPSQLCGLRVVRLDLNVRGVEWWW
jgi:hypothetical protein